MRRRKVGKRGVRVKYDHMTKPSDEEAARNFRVGFWEHKHKALNNKGVGHHPAYVYGREGQQYKYLGVTKDGRRSGHHSNVPLTSNPEPHNKNNAYLRRAESDHYRKFVRFYPDWKFSVRDYNSAVKKAKK